MKEKGFVSLFVIGMFAIISIVGFVYLRGTQLRPSSNRESLTLIESSITPSQTEKELAYQNETQKEWNSSKTFAFYYKSTEEIFSSHTDPEGEEASYVSTDNPLKVCFEENSDKKGKLFYQNSEITAHIYNEFTKKDWVLSVIGDTLAPNGCTRVVAWVDTTHLLRSACGGDQSSFCNYDVVNVNNNSYKEYASSYNQGVPWIIDTNSKDWQSWMEENGNVMTNTIGAYTFSQYCKDVTTCRAILIYKNLPDSAIFPYASYIPRVQLSTTKPMAKLDLSSSENVTGFYKQVKIGVGEKGYFVFDLNNGMVMNQQGL